MLTRHRSSGSSRPLRHRQMGTTSPCPVSRITVDLEYGRLGIRRGKMIIMPAQMKAIFDPVINRVISLVKGQIITTETDIKAVLLVGGFGQNFYLKERLCSFLGSSIEVRQPPNSWTAVVRGAVMMGAQSDAVQLKSRVARKHYGISLEYPFDANRHSLDQKYTNCLLSSRNC